MKKYKLTPYGKRVTKKAIKYLFCALLCVCGYILMILEIIFLASLFVPRIF